MVITITITITTKSTITITITITIKITITILIKITITTIMMITITTTITINYNYNYNYALHHRFRLSRWVVWSEVLVLLYLPLHRQQLRLELVAEVGKSGTDVVCQLLVEDLLEVSGSHTISHVPVNQYGQSIR